MHIHNNGEKTRSLVRWLGAFNAEQRNWMRQNAWYNHSDLQEHKIAYPENEGEHRFLYLSPQLFGSSNTNFSSHNRTHFFSASKTNFSGNDCSSVKFLRNFLRKRLMFRELLPTPNVMARIGWIPGSSKLRRSRTFSTLAWLFPMCDGRSAGSREQYLSVECELHLTSLRFNGLLTCRNRGYGAKLQK